jgi:hypothetical protein
MTRLLKNKPLISLVFGLYQMLICLFFGAYDFLNSEVNQGMYLALVFVYIAVVQFVAVYIESHIERSKAARSLFFSVSFMISGVVGGSLSYFTFTRDLDNYLIYIASFLISAFLPTVFFLLYFVYEDAAARISDMRKVSVKEGATEVENKPEKLFHLENENGKILLEVPVDRIICYEANDNYVVTYYLDRKDQLKRSMERVSLKKIEELLYKEQVTFFRVHKSYLINPEYLEEIKGKAQAYKLQMRHFETMVPVSRSYDISLLGKRDY